MAGAVVGDNITGRCDSSKLVEVVADFDEIGDVLLRRLDKTVLIGMVLPAARSWMAWAK